MVQTMQAPFVYSETFHVKASLPQYTNFITQFYVLAVSQTLLHNIDKWRERDWKQVDKIYRLPCLTFSVPCESQNSGTRNGTQNGNTKVKFGSGSIRWSTTIYKIPQTRSSCFCIRVGETSNVLLCVPLKSFSIWLRSSQSHAENVKLITWVRLGPGWASALSWLLAYRWELSCYYNLRTR